MRCYTGRILSTDRATKEEKEGRRKLSKGRMKLWKERVGSKKEQCSVESHGPLFCMSAVNFGDPGFRSGLED
jgi:hypothetical protein